MMDPDLVRMLQEVRPNRTIADSIEELIIEPVHLSYFLHKTGPQDYYSVRKVVSDEEIAAFQENIAARMIQKALMSGHRKEAVAFGLIAAALELCTRICQDARYVHADQHGEGLAQEILQHFARKLFQQSPEDEPSTGKHIVTPDSVRLQKDDLRHESPAVLAAAEKLIEEYSLNDEKAFELLFRATNDLSVGVKPEPVINSLEYDLKNGLI
jgi:hypothetical protein